MTTIQEVYSTSVSEFIQFVQLCDYEVCDCEIKVPIPNLLIVKGNDKSDINVHPPVKGLIFKYSTGEIIAPGIAPLLKSATETPIGYSPAIDGILLRIYRYNGQVHWSTAGMFNPANGHWGKTPDGSTRTFGDMIEDVKSQVNESLLKDGLCYFAMLEHSDKPGVYRPVEKYAMLTLIRVVSLNGTVHQMQDLATDFQAVFSRVLEFRPGVPSETDLAFLTESLPASPVAYDKYGIVLYYSDGFPVRVLSKHAEEAAALHPNFPMVWQHWIYCLTHGGMDAINKYVAFFPWRASEFNLYTERCKTQGSNLSSLSNKEIKAIILTHTEPGNDEKCEPCKAEPPVEQEPGKVETVITALTSALNSSSSTEPLVQTACVLS